MTYGYSHLFRLRTVYCPTSNRLDSKSFIIDLEAEINDFFSGALLEDIFSYYSGQNTNVGDEKEDPSDYDVSDVHCPSLSILGFAVHTAAAGGDYVGSMLL
jgi:hypothetical protein